MKIKTITLAVILVILAGYICVFEKNAEKPISKVVKIIDFDPENVQEIVIKRRDGIISFKREKGSWKIEQPEHADAVEQNVRGILDLFRYGIVRVIDDSPRDINQFGLDRPDVEFGIKLKQEKSFRTVSIGGDSPRGTSCYAQVNGSPRIYLLGIAYKEELNRDLRFFIK